MANCLGVWNSYFRVEDIFVTSLFWVSFQGMLSFWPRNRKSFLKNDVVVQRHHAGCECKRNWNPVSARFTFDKLRPVERLGKLGKTNSVYNRLFWKNECSNRLDKVFSRALCQESLYSDQDWTKEWPKSFVMFFRGHVPFGLLDQICDFIDHHSNQKKQCLGEAWRGQPRLSRMRNF